jgi:Asp/Glu/hydantoin racemase
MRVLIINPNTTASITDRICGIASRLHPKIVFVPATGRFGAEYISSRAASAIAGHATLDAYAAKAEGCHAVLLACFGDPGLFALREIASIPVIGLAEASCQAAAAGGRRFSIVTGGERWGAMLHEFVSSIGLSAQCASIKCVAPTGGEIANNPDKALSILSAACNRCAEEDHADIVILGGAGLAGLAERIQPAIKVPVLCSIEAGIQRVVEALEQPFEKPEQGDLAFPSPVTTQAISEELSRLLFNPVRHYQ